jgi:hypothetical protein
MTSNAPTPQESRDGRAAHRRKMPTSTRRAIVIGLAFALFVGVWLGSTGVTGRTPHTVVSLKLLGSDDATTTTTPTTDPTTTTTTPTTAVTPPPPAPDDYASQLDSMYSQIYAVSSQLPNAADAASLSTPAQFDAQVSSASSDDLGYIYQAVPSSTLTSVTTALTQALPVENEVAQSVHVNMTHAATPKSTSTLTHLAPRDIEPGDLTIVPETMPTNDPYTGDVSGNTYTASCPPGAPSINASDIYGEGDLFAIQIAIDVVDGAYNGLSPGAGTDSPVGIGFFVAAAVLAVVGIALQVTEDTLSYFQTIAGDCQEAQMQQVGIDTDNNTFQTYTLLSDVAGTVNEIDQGVDNLTNQDTSEFQQQLTLDIEQSLTAPPGTTPMSSFELPVSYEGITLGGYMNSTPVGVNEVVANTIQDIQTTGQTMNPQAIRDQSLAEQAMASGQFKLAFDYFRLAYQAAAG